MNYTIAIRQNMVMEDAFGGPVFCIPLTRSQIALVDEADYHLLTLHKLQALKGRKTWYAIRTVRQNGKRNDVYMHRHILDAASHEGIVDHHNRNGLDNRRSNLRFANHSLNGANAIKSNASTWYRGVYKKRQRWRAMMMVCGKRLHLGTYESPELAAIAYDSAAKKHFGAFAVLNFTTNQPTSKENVNE